MILFFSFFNKQRLHNDARIFIQINSRKHTQNNLKKRILYYIYLDCTISDVGKRKIRNRESKSPPSNEKNTLNELSGFDFSQAKPGGWGESQ